MAEPMIPRGAPRASTNTRPDLPSSLAAGDISRRAFLTGATITAAGLAAVTAAASSVDQSQDQALFAAWEEFCARRDDFSSLPIDWTDEQCKPYGEVMDEAEERFLSIPPVTFAGIALKLRHAWYWNATEVRPDGWDIVLGRVPIPEGLDFTESTLLRLIRDVDALSGKPAYPARDSERKAQHG